MSEDMKEIDCSSFIGQYPYDPTKIYYRELSGSAERYFYYHGFGVLSALGRQIRVSHTSVIALDDEYEYTSDQGIVYDNKRIPGPYFRLM